MKFIGSLFKGKESSSAKTLCFITARNFGDTVFMSTFFRQLAEYGFADKYIVWTRSPMAFLFADIPNCKVIYSKFPIAISGGFSIRDLLKFSRDIIEIRRLKPTFSLDMVGDFRERMFGRLVGSCRHIHIGWAPDHPYRRIIRNPFGSGRPALVISSKIANVYSAYGIFVSRLLGATTSTAKVKPTPLRRELAEHINIGLHPSASQECKIWPSLNWAHLAQLLLKADMKVTAFGAPNEFSALEVMFQPLQDQVRIVSTGIPEFARALTQIDLLVGLDSFAVHMAEAVGTPSVMLVGANDPVLFAPPGTTVISSSGGCLAWPCFNVPSCVGSSAEYVCIKSIPVDRVHATIINIVSSIRGAECRGRYAS